MNRVTVESDSSYKSKASGWLLTINSNKTLADYSLQEFKRDITTFIQGFSGSDYFTVRQGYKPDPSMEVKVKFKSEISPKMKRLHCHLALYVEHNSNILLNYQAMKSNLPDGFNLGPPKFIRGVMDFNKVFGYIDKNPID